MLVAFLSIVAGVTLVTGLLAVRVVIEEDRSGTEALITIGFFVVSFLMFLAANRIEHLENEVKPVKVSNCGGITIEAPHNYTVTCPIPK